MKKNTIALLGILCAYSPVSDANSYEDYVIEPANEQLDNSKQMADKPITFLPLPVFITEPAVGPGLGVVGLYFHGNKKQQQKTSVDTVLPKSISLVGLMATKNGTKGAAVGHVSFWNQDSLRYQGILAYADINLDFYSFAGFEFTRPLALNIAGPGLLQSLKQRYQDSNFFFGAKQIYRHVEIALAEPLFNQLPDPVAYDLNKEVGIDIDTSGVGALFEYDSRDNPLNPEQGVNYKAEYMIYNQAIGSDIDYTSFNLSALNYWALNAKTNLALRVEFDTVNNKGDKKLPVYIPPSISLRGVSASRYQGLNVLVTEFEGSYKITDKIKLSAFTGMGWAAEHFSTLADAKTINTVGMGFRYLIDEHYGINIGLDVAHGPEQDVVYIQAGSTW
ncbi:BamA/TamA family outer membrane protein [Pseudoalteromonas haloplanktis]|uniref:BamA/TamA family outer membrane protein n=1 Tax=Pseudoalteromonas haloplanktis TaxID=228 RepID=A0ABU1BFJ0_PSEHA|nr:BamA/TamA family outer membrane protein [Pseudoalteromonas haloplanktis]MDQ9093190.1 BamA/TamA family outer membrane protein [Pseudoalteromonas haloplanktis]